MVDELSTQFALQLWKLIDIREHVVHLLHQLLLRLELMGLLSPVRLLLLVPQGWGPNVHEVEAANLMVLVLQSLRIFDL